MPDGRSSDHERTIEGPALRSSVLVIGDEILGGFVQDTNSGFLAGRLQTLGVPLDRVVTVPDQLDAIGEALHAELRRSRPRIVLTSGGIGSTPDDLTLAAIAEALDRRLVRHPEIDERLRGALDRTAARGVEVSEEHARSLRRMALVPDGAYLLAGARGVVPGIAISVDEGISQERGATIVVLPGVPAELQRIMVDGVEPELLEGRGRPQHVRELSHPYPESMLTPLLEQLVRDYPDMHVGSYPGESCVIRLKGSVQDVETGLARLRAALDAIATDPSSRAMAESWRNRRRS